MKLRQFQVDAFASRVFEGNPAAVVPLESWLDDGVLQAIAGENNLAETAFFVSSARGLRLRRFTPVAEVDLCGHATLATAHALFEPLGHAGPAITFETRSGDLIVRRQGPLLVMDFPARPSAPTMRGSAGSICGGWSSPPPGKRSISSAASSLRIRRPRGSGHRFGAL